MLAYSYIISLTYICKLASISGQSGAIGVWEYKIAHLQHFHPKQKQRTIFLDRLCLCQTPSMPAESLLVYSSIYEVLALETYQGDVSTCISRRSPWRKAWGKAFHASQSVYGTMLHGKCSQKKDRSFADRCLPEPAISALGFLSLLIHWFRNWEWMLILSMSMRKFLNSACKQPARRGQIRMLTPGSSTSSWPQTGSHNGPRLTPKMLWTLESYV